MKKGLQNNLPALMIAGFFLTLAGIGWLARAEMAIGLFEQQIGLRIWGTLLLVMAFALLAWYGLSQAEEPENKNRTEPCAPAGNYGLASEIKSRYPNLSQEEHPLRA